MPYKGLTAKDCLIKNSYAHLKLREWHVNPLHKSPVIINITKLMNTNTYTTHWRYPNSELCVWFVYDEQVSVDMFACSEGFFLRV